MEIVVTGRNVEVPEHFRVHVAEKVERLERYDHKIAGLEVELFHERNRRQMKNCQRIEITGRGCGPVARAEACAQDFYAAWTPRSRSSSRGARSHDRRRITARRTTVLVGPAAAKRCSTRPPRWTFPRRATPWTARWATSAAPGRRADMSGAPR